MSLVTTRPLQFISRAGRSFAMTAPTLARLLSVIQTITMKRSAALLVAFGVPEPLRRKKSNILAREAWMSFLRSKISSEGAGHKNTMIASLKKDIADYQLREEQKNSELLVLKDSLKEAVSQQSSLLQGLAEGTALVVRLTAGMEEREREIRAKTAEVESLVEVLKQEEARNGEREGQLLVSVAKEIKGELEGQLDLMRQTLAANNRFIAGLQTKIDCLEEECAPKEQGVVSLEHAEEELKTSESSIQEEDSEISTLKRRIQEYEGQMVEKDALILDLSSKVGELRSDEAQEKDIPYDLWEKAVEEKEKLWQSKASEIEGKYATKLQGLNNSLDVMRSTLSEKDVSEGELERKVAQMEGDCAEKERRIRSLLKVNRKQEERLAEMEGRILVLTSTYEDLADMRTKEKERFENDIRSLRQTLTETNDLITKVERKVAELEAEAAAKDEKVKSLSQAERDLKARIARRDRSIAEFKAQLAAATTPTSPSRAQKPLRSRQDLLPDMQTAARYEEKIAELTDKLAECHSLLKNCLNSPSPRIPPSPLWPPPYEPATTSNNADARTVVTASLTGFDTPVFAEQVRFSAP